jgi:ribonuclease PH
MSENIQRAYGRAFDQLRDIRISYNVFGYAPGSVLFELGNTKVLCSVTMQVGVPPFLKGTKTGWLTAEYAMLPTSCQTRATRESSQAKRNDRSVEISRLIGRSLRAVVDLKRIGERTIYVDCDVLQADGSTRTAAITGAFLALKKADEYWLNAGDIVESIIIDSVAAVSAGLTANCPLLDLDYAEDSIIEADYNFILTRSEKIVEIQGAAEKNALTWQQFEQLKNLAIKGTSDLFARMNLDTQKIPLVKPANNSDTKKQRTDAPLFSLKNRFVNAG